MTKLFIVWTLLALSGLIFANTGYSARFEFLSLPLSVAVDRVSFFTMLALGLSWAFNASWVLAVVSVLGSVLVGPLAALLMVSFIVFNRMDRLGPTWFRYKDLLSFILMAVACAVPEPYRSILLWLGALGVSIDFGLSKMRFLPTLLLFRTLQGIQVDPAVLSVMVWVAVLLIIVFILKSKAITSLEGIYSCSATVAVFSLAFSVPPAMSLPFVMVAGLLSIIAVTKPRWVRLCVASSLSGFPLFVGTERLTLLLGGNLLWAIPAVPLLLFFAWFQSEAGRGDDGSALNDIHFSDLWFYSAPALVIVLLVSLHFIWWNPWQGDLGLGQMLFGAEVSGTAGLDLMQMWIGVAIIVLGALVGLALTRLKLQKNEDVFLSKFFENIASRGSELIIRSDEWVSSRLFWKTNKDEAAVFGLGKLVGLLTVSLFLAGLLLVGYYQLFGVVLGHGGGQ